MENKIIPSDSESEYEVNKILTVESESDNADGAMEDEIDVNDEIICTYICWAESSKEFAMSECIRLFNKTEEEINLILKENE